MTDTKWTPGPWEIKEWSGFDYGTKQYSIPAVATNIHIKANANLIAAAPELYAALEIVSGMDLHHEVLAIVDAAMRKARGEP